VSQVATKKRLALREERVAVSARFSEQGSVLRGTREGRCEGFHIELAIESDEPAEELAELVRLAHRMCFTEAALAAAVEITTADLVNGRPIPRR
jgi:organic hydroperoxide reductase OsmC/OhrA